MGFPLCGEEKPSVPQGIEFIQMTVGETLERRFAEAKTLQLSRKGLLELVFMEGHRWQLTALKPGFVVLSALKEGEVSLSRLHVEIHAKGKLDSEASPRWLQTCEAGGFHCAKETGLITGETHSFFHHWQLQKICHRDKACTYGGRLSTRGLVAWKDFVAAGTSAPFAYEINSRGALQVVLDCASPEALQQQKPMVQAWVEQHFSFLPPPLILCRNWFHQGYYRLTFKALLMEKSTAKELGFDSKIEARMPPLPLNVGYEAALHDSIHGRKVQILAEPMIRLNAGVVAHAQSGGEFPVLVKKSRGMYEEEVVEPTWKEHGIKLEAAVFPVAKDHVRLRYDFSLKNPTSDSFQHIQIQRLQSELEVKIGVPFIVGQIDFLSDGSRDQGMMFLRAIPIVGPLFTLEFFDNAQTNLYLWMRLEEDVPPEAREEFLPEVVHVEGVPPSTPPPYSKYLAVKDSFTFFNPAGGP